MRAFAPYWTLRSPCDDGAYRRPRPAGYYPGVKGRRTAGMTAAEQLAALIGHPERVVEVSFEAMPALLLELAVLQSALAARLAAAARLGDEIAEQDRLIPADEAAGLLGGVSKDFLYRSPAARPLRVRIGGRVLFSHAKVQAYIRRRAGRE